jgi:alanine racemase
MDQTMVEVGHIPGIRVGDEVVLIGRQGEEKITVEEIAEKIGTVPHEIVCRLGKRVPRIYPRE